MDQACGAAEMLDLNEVNNLLAERVRQWTEEWKTEGLQAGMQQGP